MNKEKLLERLQSHCDEYLVAPKNVFIEVDNIIMAIKNQGKEQEDNQENKKVAEKEKK